MTTFYNVCKVRLQRPFFKYWPYCVCGLLCIARCCAEHLGSIGLCTSHGHGPVDVDSLTAQGSCFSTEAAEARLVDMITQSHRASKVRGLCSGNLVQPCVACSTVSTGCRWEASVKLVGFTEGQREYTIFCSLRFRELYSHQYSPFYSILKFSWRIVNPWTLVPEKYLSTWWACPCFHCSLMKIMKGLFVCGHYVLRITWNLNERDLSRPFDYPGCRNRWVAAWITLPQDLPLRLSRASPFRTGLVLRYAGQYFNCLPPCNVSRLRKATL